MCLFKSKFDKLQRDDVVNAICQIEKQSKEIETGIIEKQAEIERLKALGKKEKSKDIQLMYAKKISALASERESLSKRAMFLLYNTKQLNSLKQAFDDNQFFASASKSTLNSLLGDQKGLAKYLEKALGTRVKAESALTGANETFEQYDQMYEKNESIYGVNSNDDALLAMFEEEEGLAQFETGEEESAGVAPGTATDKE